MRPSFLGVDSRGVEHFHNWQAAGHLFILGRENALGTLDNLANDVHEQGGAVLAAGWRSARRKQASWFDIENAAVHSPTVRVGPVLKAAEKVAEARIREHYRARREPGFWDFENGPATVLFIEGANILEGAGMMRVRQLIRVGRNLGIYVVLSSGNHTRIENPRNAFEYPVSAMRMGHTLYGKREGSAPNQNAAVYSPLHGARQAFVVTPRSSRR